MEQALRDCCMIQAALARLDRLEDDHDAGETLGNQSDDEFRLDESDEGQLCRFHAIVF